MDRRQQKSRNAILKAFEELLTQHNYNKITVQEIIDKANVGRSTFYAHFETKDALLEEMCTNLFHHVFSEHPEVESNHDFSLTEGDSRKIVTHILYHLRDYGATLSKLLTGESSDIFLQYFTSYLNKLMVNCLLVGMKRKNPLVSEGFLRNHVSGSFVIMVQWWIKNGMKETPEDLTDYYFAVIDPIL